MLDKGNFSLAGSLSGHKGRITKIATSAKNPKMIISSSRDYTMLSWKIDKDSFGLSGKPVREYKGHNHFVSDVTLSSDGLYGLSASWDKSLCLWDVETGNRTKGFVGHTEEVYALAMSSDNRQIVSASADSTVRLWNTMGQCKYIFKEEGHMSTVSSVSLCSVSGLPIMISGGYDKVAKAWMITKPSLLANMHTKSGVTCTQFSPDNSYIAAGTQHGHLYIWFIYNFIRVVEQPLGKSISAIAFRPNSPILAVACGNCIHLLNVSGVIQSAHKKTSATYTCPELDKLSFDESNSTDSGPNKILSPDCTALTWSPDGLILYAGYADATIRMWQWTSSSIGEAETNDGFYES